MTRGFDVFAYVYFTALYWRLERESNEIVLQINRFQSREYLYARRVPPSQEGSMPALSREVNIKGSCIHCPTSSTPFLTTMSTSEIDRTELENMIAGKPYSAGDPHIQQVATAQRKKVEEINAEKDEEKREKLIKSFLKCKEDANVAIVMPFFCEYVCLFQFTYNQTFNPFC